MTIWSGETAGTFAAVVLVIADMLPAPSCTIGPCASPHITVYTFCFTAGGTATLSKARTRTGAYTFWYGWPEEVTGNMMYSPEWAMFTETKWDWFDVANCIHIFQIQSIVTTRLKYQIVIAQCSCFSYRKEGASSYIAIIAMI